MTAPHPAAFKPVTRGPQQGAPPSLEFIAVDRLEVDPAYQRATDGPQSRRIIVGMVRRWDWSLCQPLVVSRRSNGALFILDGQHRHAGARERGDIAHLPCVVHPALEPGAEARAFVDLNTRRQALSQADIFHGLLAASDPDAIAVAALIEATGWHLVRGKPNGKWKPGSIACGPALVRGRKLHGGTVVEAALRTVRAAWPNAAVDSPVRLFQALFEIYRERGQVPPARHADIAATLAQKSPAGWLALAEERRAHQPHLSSATALVAAIVRTFAPVVPAPAATAAPKAQPATRAAAIPGDITPAFGTAGKGWCSQCDELVDRPTARHCKSQFCKMREQSA